MFIFFSYCQNLSYSQWCWLKINNKLLKQISYLSFIFGNIFFIPIGLMLIFMYIISGLQDLKSSTNNDDEW